MPASWIAFDLGGVLYDIAIDRYQRRLMRSFSLTSQAIDAATFGSGLWSKMGCGEIDGDGFLRAVLEGLNQVVGPETLSEITSAWGEVLELRPGVDALLSRIDLSIAAWSNTDPVHGAAIRTDPVLSRYIKTWAFSFELGVEKPDRNFYERALALLKANPSDVVFVDDRPENISAAKAMGIDAFEVNSLGDLEAGLTQRALLTK